VAATNDGLLGYPPICLESLDPEQKGSRQVPLVFGKDWRRSKIMSEEVRTETRTAVIFLRVPYAMKKRLTEFAISDEVSLNKLANRIFEEWGQNQSSPPIPYKQKGE
jgi:hypothetical protein